MMKIVLNVDVDNTDDLSKELVNLSKWVKDPDYDTKWLMDGSYQVGKTNVTLDLEEQ